MYTASLLRPLALAAGLALAVSLSGAPQARAQGETTTSQVCAHLLKLDATSSIAERKANAGRKEAQTWCKAGMDAYKKDMGDAGWATYSACLLAAEDSATALACRP